MDSSKQGNKMPIGIGAGLAISGGATLLGGLANIFSNNATNRSNRNAQERANQQNYQAQKEFLQNSVLWRKQDALRAGINPIYAMGMQSTGFSPSFQAYQQSANDYSFLGKSAERALEYYQAAKQFELNEKQAQANINRDNAQAELFLAQKKQIENKGQKATPTPKKTNEMSEILKAEKQGNWEKWLELTTDTTKGLRIQTTPSGISIQPNDQTIMAERYSEPGFWSDLIPGGGWIEMQKMSWENADAYQKALQSLRDKFPNRNFYIEKKTKTGIWEIREDKKGSGLDSYDDNNPKYKDWKKSYEYNTEKDYEKIKNSPLIKGRKDRGL